MSDPGPDAPDDASLADVLEALVTSVSRARVQADIRSAQISQMYLKHDMLRRMPVPRLRLNRVQVNLPLVVTTVRRGVAFTLDNPGSVAHQVAEELRREVESMTEGLVAEVAHALEDGSAIVPGTEAATLVARLRVTLDDALRFLGANTGASGVPPTASGSAIRPPPAGVAPPDGEADSELPDDAAPGARGSRPPPADDRQKPKTFRRLLRGALAAALQPFIDGRSLRDATSELSVQELCSNAVERAVRNLLAINCGLHRRAPDAALGFELEAFYPILLGEKEPPRGEGGAKLKGLEGGYGENLYRALLKAIPDLIERLGLLAGKAALATPGSPPEIMIAAHTVDVKNEGTPSTITRINMVMTEEGLEWVAESSDDGGSPNWKLMPE